MDAPSHFIEGLKSIDQIDIKQFTGKGAVIDLH